MKKFIIQTYSLFAYNAKSMIIFGVLYSILSFFTINAVINGSMTLALRVSGVSYLGNNTIGTFLSSPFVWLLLLFASMLVTYLTLISHCAITYAFNASRLEKKITVKDMVGAGLFNARRVFKKNNLGLIPYTLVLMPFVSSIELLSTSFSIDLPGFILDAILSNRTLTILFVVFLFLLLLFALRLILSIPIYTIEECSFNDACIKSSKLIKNKKLIFLINFILIDFTLIVFLAIIFVIIYFICLIIPEVIESNNIMRIGLLIFIVIATIVIFSARYIYLGYTANAYFVIAEDKQEDLSLTLHKHNMSRLSAFIMATLFVVSVVSTLITNSYDVLFAHKASIVPSIAAHRGDSVRAPENSMPAFELAIEEGKASWVELDVHQTKDGIIVVSHDDYLGKIGIDRYVHESTYEELMKYDSGAYFSDKYKGLHLCTLKEALELMKDKIFVQIEIKPTEYDDHIEEAVVDIIREVNSNYMTAVLSLKDTPIKRIKEIAPDITTIYCTIIAGEGIEKLDYADWYSIEETSISKDLVSKIHREGKKCFVWTINKKDNVQHLVDCGVDAILTDDPIMMSEALAECNYVDSILNSFEQFAFKYIDILKNIID